MKKPALRSRRRFDNPPSPDAGALCLGRRLNFGLAREELLGGAPGAGD